MHERQGRDRGWFDQMRAAYRPDSTVRLSWFTGNGLDFVDQTEEMNSRAGYSVHRLCPPSVRVREDRAHAETSVTVEFQVTFDGIPAHLVSYTRANCRLLKENGAWGLLTLDSIYERATLTPAIPGQSIVVDPEEVAGLRPSYALVALYLKRQGFSIPTDLLGDDRPEEVAAFYQELNSWLIGSEGSA
jgi:hypothetical protein